MSNIHFLDKGSGTPLVLIHGYCEHSNVWDPLIPSLSKNHRLLIPDLPGFGKTASTSNCDLNEISNQLYAWLTEIGIQECSLLGHSMGGYIVLAFEEQFPQFSTSFGLFHSTSYADSEDKKKTRTGVSKFIRKYGRDKFIESLVPALFYKDNSEKSYFRNFMSIALESNPQSIVDYAIAMRDRPDRRHVLHSEKKPILFISGKYDGVIPYEQSIEQADNYSHIRFCPLEDTGHMGMYEASEQCVSAIMTFFEE